MFQLRKTHTNVNLQETLIITALQCQLFVQLRDDLLVLMYAKMAFVWEDYRMERLLFMELAASSKLTLNASGV